MDVLSSWVICMSEGGWLWIRFPKFPIELFNDQFLWRLGSTPGVMLKIDRVMTIQARGCFTRICVEIDLYKPLQPKIIARAQGCEDRNNKSFGSKFIALNEAREERLVSRVKRNANGPSTSGPKGVQKQNRGVVFKEMKTNYVVEEGKTGPTKNTGPVLRKPKEKQIKGNTKMGIANKGKASKKGKQRQKEVVPTDPSIVGEAQIKGGRSNASFKNENDDMVVCQEGSQGHVKAIHVAMPP
ncbi:hypothetical protein JHK87_012364 [Glycine soja]|nr:hypothetical protein JHK87_012364 [Glycine soja]